MILPLSSTFPRNGSTIEQQQTMARRKLHSPEMVALPRPSASCMGCGYCFINDSTVGYCTSTCRTISHASVRCLDVPVIDTCIFGNFLDRDLSIGSSVSLAIFVTNAEKILLKLSTSCFFLLFQVSLLVIRRASLTRAKYWVCISFVRASMYGSNLPPSLRLFSIPCSCSQVQREKFVWTEHQLWI